MRKKYSVLVVDDQENWRELFVELLEDEFEVTSVDNYDAALAKIQKRVLPFHVLVTDMRLIDSEAGNEDGLKLAKELKQRGDITNIIVVTGYSSLRTVKRALGILDVFDYLEKRPEDSSPFNPAEFLRTVRAAAEQAEKKRPQSLTLENKCLLLLISDSALREKLKAILLEKQYEVTAISIPESIPQTFQNMEKSFAITLIGEDLFEKQDILDALQATQPQTRIILLAKEENRIVEMVHHHPVANIISLLPSKSDRLKILDGIQQATLSAYAKFGVLEIEIQGENLKISENMRLRKHIPYTFGLRIQNTPTLASFPITLSAIKKGAKSENTNLEVLITPKQMKITPGGKLLWDITKPLKFQIEPLAKGKKEILLEVRQGYRLVGKKEISFNIS